MNVPVSEFRNSIDHLYRLINVDYHSCINTQELCYWVKRVERLIETVKVLECKRAKLEDRDNHKKCLKLR